MKYIIDLVVIYIPSDRALILHNNPQNTVVLSTPANRLLMELIRNRGEVVTRDELLERVWEDYGFTGSNSNLNSYISEIRKSISSLDDKLNIITTVPKVGFRLEANIESSIDTTKEEAVIPPVQVASEAKISGKEMAESMSPAEKKRPYKMFMALSSLLALVAAFSTYWMLHTRNDSIHLSQMEPNYIFSDGKCQVYSLNVKNSKIEELIKKRARGYIEEGKLDCTASKKDIYYKINPTNVNLNFIGICTAPQKTQDEHCISILRPYRDEELK
jgi:DNA-binding winged helix-turn-helix (wHTH) protein